jgi:hypothetical protein
MRKFPHHFKIYCLRVQFDIVTEVNVSCALLQYNSLCSYI